MSTIRSRTRTAACHRVAIRSSARAACCLPLAALFVLCAGTASAQAAPDTIVRRAGPPKHAGVGTLVTELAIGSVDGPAEYAFGQVTEVLQARDGSLLVLDAPSAAAPELRQYDARGRYIRTIGRSGSGPGEYRSPGGLAQLPDGRILLLDGAQRRVNVYAETGASLDTWSLGDVVARSGGSGGLRVGPDGSVYARAAIRREGATLFSTLAPSVVRLAPDGHVADFLPDPDLPDVGGTITRSTSNMSKRAPIPYAPQAVRAFSPLGGFVTGTTERYAFELRIPRAPAGSAPKPWTPADGVVSIRRDVAPVAVPRAERADQRRHLEAVLEGVGTLSKPIPDIAAAKPPYRAIDVGDDGRIWITLSTPSERYDPPPPSESESVSIGVGRGGAAGQRAVIAAPPVPWREPTRYDVFEPDGSYIGQVAVPFDTRLLRMRGDTVWGVTVDADDVPTAKRFRIAWR